MKKNFEMNPVAKGGIFQNCQEILQSELKSQPMTHTLVWIWNEHYIYCSENDQISLVEAE